MAENQASITNPAGLSGTLIRKGGQIFQDRAISPEAGKAQGDNVDQAKMRGTQAQKTPVVKETVKPITSTTVSPQGLAAGETEQISQQKAQAEQLQQFSTYSDRVKAIAQKKYAGAIGTPVGMKAADAEILNTAFSEGQVVGPDGRPLSEFLEEYANNLQIGNLSPAQQEQPLIELSAALKAEGVYVEPMALKGWYQTIEDRLGEEAATRIDDNVIMADFGEEDLQSLGFDNAQQVADLIGITDLQDFKSLTLSEFNQAVEDRRQEIFNEVNELQRQLSLAPPGSQVAKQIQQRLSDLSGAGVATTERRMEELVEQLNTDITIDVGGQSYNVEELLADDNVSQFVADYLAASPQDRETMFPAGFEGFQQWVNENEASLQALVAEQERIATGFGETQEALRGFTTAYGPEIPQDILDKMGIDVKDPGQMTTDDFNAMKQQFEESNIGQVWSNPEAYGLSGGDQADLVRKIQSNFDQVGSWDTQTMVDRYRAALDLTDPSKTISQLSNISGDFVADKDIATYGRLVAASEVMDTLDTVYRETLTQDPELLKMIQDGSLTPDLIAQVPENLQAFQKAEKDVDQWDVLAANDGKALNVNYKNIQKWALTGDPAAKEMLAKYMNIDTDGDGKFSPGELASIQATLTDRLDKKKFMLGDVTSTDGLIKSGDVANATGIYSRLQQLMVDDEITRAEAEQLLAEAKTPADKKAVEALLKNAKKSGLVRTDKTLPTNQAELAELIAAEDRVISRQQRGKEVKQAFDTIAGTSGIKLDLRNGGSIDMGKKTGTQAFASLYDAFGKLQDVISNQERMGPATGMTPTDTQALKDEFVTFRDQVIGPKLTEVYQNSIREAMTKAVKEIDRAPVGSGINVNPLLRDKKIEQAFEKILKEAPNPASWGFSWKAAAKPSFSMVANANTGAVSRDNLLGEFITPLTSDSIRNLSSNLDLSTLDKLPIPRQY